ncbi:hypothetical protein GDO86_014628 [Hymenochirus boettgeri]|uniref:RNB domain-containing protein n=1 Tax=Hymenochirus boettgeri TaxID=247094 RepID=A0A8T2JUF9_9PIPI|nr:hypothetical protein GDO86_014628 [Hymenochirus boettgeri]
MGQSRSPEQTSLAKLRELVELRLACGTCCQKKFTITYILCPCLQHTCDGHLLLAKCRNAGSREEWYEVRRLPKYPLPARYEVCWHYRPHRGCIRHQQNCTFSWSEEEKLIWSFERQHNLERSQLKALLLPAPCPGTSPKASSSWQDIINEYSGLFQEVCEQCFYQSPPMVTLTSLCQSHPRPVPLLMHIVVDDTKKQCHPIHPLPSFQHIHLCNQSTQGLFCGAAGRQCPKAHSEVELAVWKAEREGGLTRGNLLREETLMMAFYCHLCRVTAISQESFEMHCSTLEHGRMMAADSLTVWNYRAPPMGRVSFILCERVFNRVGLQNYLSEEIEGIQISCDLPLKVSCPEKPAKKQWQFTVQSKMTLLHVALLKCDPGATFSLNAPDLPELCPYARGSSFRVIKSRVQEWKVVVTVEGSVYGAFEQWLVLDFGLRPALLQKIFLLVGEHNNSEAQHDENSTEERSVLSSSKRWHPGKQLYIPCKERTQKEKHLLELYKQPVLNLNQQQVANTRLQTAITCENYRHQMHKALLQEESAREEVISRLNLEVTVKLCKMVILRDGMKGAPQGELLTVVTIPSGITLDSEEGFLLHRSVATALIAKSPLGDKVYEVSVDAGAGSENSILLQIPERCCSELALENGTCAELEIQFQLDRLQFCMYHEAVDRLLDEKLLFPDLSKCRLPFRQETPSWGNPKQQLAASYICGTAPETQPIPLLLIYGPFGTGKSYTMAKAALDVIKQPGTRVLICTHNNSAADLYVRDHFHEYASSGHPEAIPMRVKYVLSPLNRTDLITQQYCPLTPDGSSFVIPSREQLERHRIIVTTAVTSRDLDVPRGFFSHILLDETAQMLECEALIPLGLADHCTRVVLAGDYMQESPRLFCRRDPEQRQEHTLLTRLFSHYQGESSQTAKEARIIFHQNYRTTPTIISFVSRCFYVGRGDAIESCAADNVAPPPGHHALGLCHVHGPCIRDGNSWLNHSELLEVLEVVQNIRNQWPKNWGPVRNSRICVVSQGSQVKLIRQELRKIKLSDVTVTDYQNIIGGEFQVIILSTVRTVDSLPSGPSFHFTFSLDFFCDPRVLNTVLTRARSQVVVVGDIVALCSFGECSRIWRRYVQECVEGGNVKPPDITVEQIKQVVCDLQTWREQAEEEEDNSDSWISDLDIPSDDSILQELLDSKAKACVTVSEEGLLEVRMEPDCVNNRNTYIDFERHKLEQYLQIQPNVYKKCMLFKDSFDRGHALTLEDSPSYRININGRVNCGMAFSGDEVLVKLLPDTNPKAGTVVGVLRATEDRCFVCYMDPHDYNIMTPIDKSITKIFCPVLKRNPVCVHIRNYSNNCVRTVGSEKLTPEMQRDKLFLVQVIKWHRKFYYPLGIVTQILPAINCLDQGLEILDMEYGLANAKKYPPNACQEDYKIIPLDGRKDCRDKLTFTVDPRGAKDLDDAISVQELGDHYEIGVHITDLTSFISPEGELDKEARKRGVTFYSPNREPLHMLPKKLCSDRCSLIPNCDRMALSLFVLVEKKSDQIVNGEFSRTLVRADRQFSYEEANSILSARVRQPLCYDTVEDCVAVCCHFSKVHRNYRLQEAATYKQPDEKCPPGVRKAQRMIEEMMLMYNSWVAEFLVGKESLMNLVPVRCQPPPSLEKIEKLRDKLSHLLPLSNYLSHHLLDAPKVSRFSPEQCVSMLTTVWQRIQASADRQDDDCVSDLLFTDDLHPQLCYATREFRRLLGRAGFTRAGTEDILGHYSLQLCAYTWASSPLRRYLDIVVQRLLQEILTGSFTTISPKDMDLMIHHFERRVQLQTSYERKGLALEMALRLKGKSQQKLAVVVSVNPTSNNFEVVFPLNSDSFSRPVKLQYSCLQPSEQPTPIPDGVRLSWKRRVYSYHTYREKPITSHLPTHITTFEASAWYDAICAMNITDHEQAVFTLRKGTKADPVSSVQQIMGGHYTEMTLDLKPGQCFPIQLCSTIQQGLPTPGSQLFSPTPGIHICLEHSERPVDCFSSLARRPPPQSYKNYQEYQQVWRPLCAMEAVVSAVREGGAVVLRNVPVKWNEKGTKMKGSFKLSSELIQECDLDMDFRNCYLCVRIEELQGSRPESEIDLQSYSWVAHCLTEGNNHVTREDGGTVSFHLHQTPMKEVPEAVSSHKTEFTIEIIPKLLPDVRKEEALEKLSKASELSKNIVFGKRVTDIGTGKTVVGVHIVYWFHQMNQELDGRFQQKDGSDRQVLMYCGPSNKSVDVVAEMLLPLRDQLRPLRVYSEQVELSEFPYPGSNLRISGYLREGKPNPELRSITLHHLIRQPSNSFSGKILQMDRRIREGDEILPEEVAEYKNLLYNARNEELRRHDIILCTCVTSSGKALTRLHVSQLVIDECAMCTEPETLVPLVSHEHVQSVVLLGDHRQLRAVVLNDLCRTLRMDHSLFERYKEKAMMLDIQYRMHTDICEFPSKEFYQGLLHTSDRLFLQPSLFCHPKKPCCPVVFGEVDGQEQSLQVTSEEGSLNSKANIKEVEQAVRLVKLLTQSKIEKSDIAILTPYNAQVSEVTKRLQREGLGDVTACTIMKSQGSEWRYVIFSTVRSASTQELDSHPTLSWQRRYLGFVTDPNQINVGLTRAKEGLCVLGNSNLLQCNLLWGRLLQHYRQKGAICHSTLINVSRNHRRR